MDLLDGKHLYWLALKLEIGFLGLQEMARKFGQGRIHGFDQVKDTIFSVKFLKNLETMESSISTRIAHTLYKGKRYGKEQKIQVQKEVSRMNGRNSSSCYSRVIYIQKMVRKINWFGLKTQQHESSRQSQSIGFVPQNYTKVKRNHGGNKYGKMKVL